jgi:hypothetical protein
MSSTDSTKLILQGEYTLTKLTNLQELLLKQCQSPQLEVLSPYITEEEFTSNIKSWKERTSTSPSGLYLG